MFSIKLGSKTYTEEGQTFLKGNLVIGGFTETFRACLCVWNKNEYENHWREAFERILGKESNSALITSMHSPAKSSHIVWWPMWRDGKNVLIQNQLLFFNQMKTAFNPLDPFVHLSKRPAAGDPKPSEWRIPLAEIRSFSF